MTSISGVSGVTGPAPRPDDAERMKKTAKKLEGVFVMQLFKAMRETVPQDEGILSGGSGEEMFSSMFDQEMSERVPAQWKHDLSDAIVSHLKSRMSGSPASASDHSTLPRPEAPESR